MNFMFENNVAPYLLPFETHAIEDGDEGEKIRKNKDKNGAL